MQTQEKLVAVFDNHADAEEAIRQLQSQGFDMKNLSLIGQDYHTEEHPVGYVTIGDRVKYWGKFGSLWGGLWGILFGSAFLVLPGVGHLIILGALASTLVNAAGGAVIGSALGALGGALTAIGLPKNAVIKYERDLKAGKFVLIAHGSDTDMKSAQGILAATPKLYLDQHLATAE